MNVLYFYIYFPCIITYDIIQSVRVILHQGWGCKIRISSTDEKQQQTQADMKE